MGNEGGSDQYGFLLQHYEHWSRGSREIHISRCSYFISFRSLAVQRLISKVAQHFLYNLFSAFFLRSASSLLLSILLCSLWLFFIIYVLFVLRFLLVILRFVIMWTDPISFQIIFLQSSYSNREVFLGSKTVHGFFSKTDERIRHIPFATRKPTLTEATEIMQRLLVVSLVDRPPWIKVNISG